MDDIVIGRYDVGFAGYTGYIEPKDRSWIIFLDENGKPSLYWPERDVDGGIVGEGLHL